MELKVGSHSVTRLVYHFTFVPKYRRRKLVGNLKQRLEGMIKFCAQVNDWEIMELDIQPDHVHLLVQTNSTDSPASIMQRLKGGTSKKLRELFPDSTEAIWLKSFWAGGYFAETIGRKNLKATTDYIRKQTEYHQNKDSKETADS